MINKVILVGRLTKDVELRKTQQGTSTCTFTVACNRRYAANGQQPQADFINCVAWRQSADFLAQYAKKGALVGVEGSIQTRNYDGQDGRKVYVTEVSCDRVQLLESRNVTESRNTGSTAGFVPNQGYAEPSFSVPAQEPSFSDYDAGITLDISSDDLPF
ncbi:MAG: single-stranded DNA-binding protein [Erysipelotrichaceae bacterium]|nr:single-stranded DNA-binding protein [Erysipelotrichaceae bacterium]